MEDQRKKSKEKLLNHRNIPMELQSVLESYSKPGRTRVTASEDKYRRILDYLKETNVANITQHNYIELFSIGLYIEEWQDNADLQYSNCQVQIDKVMDAKNSYRIMLPINKMNENIMYMMAESLEVKDSVTLKNCKLKIKHLASNYIVVTGSQEFRDTYTSDHAYTVKFHFNNYTYQCSHFGLSLLNFKKLKPRLYPEDSVLNVETWNVRELEFFNDDIKSNKEQMQAVANILNKSSYPVPFIVYGPPGTGKTATIIEAVCQAWRQDNTNKILICTPSNTAADSITVRLAQYIPKKDILRFYSQSRNRFEINDMVAKYSNAKDGYTIDSEAVTPDVRIVICTLCQSTRLLIAGLRDFAYLFIDEASQAMEPDTLIPFHLNPNIHIILSGDPQQLGPVVKSKLAEPILGRSMMERLMTLKIFKKNSSNQYISNYIIKLLKNYRSHPAIINISNGLFYDNELEFCGGKDTLAAERWFDLPNPKFPIIFHAVQGNEEKVRNSDSAFNNAELKVVMEYIQKLSKNFRPKDIGIVTPFCLQSQKLQKDLHQKKLSNIMVGTVELFQGQERDVMILSTVRSKTFCHDEKHHIGSLSNQKRFNVAITRAKAMLIIVGNPEILKIDKNWKFLIDNCIKNNAYREDRNYLETKNTLKCLPEVTLESTERKKCKLDDGVPDAKVMNSNKNCYSNSTNHRSYGFRHEKEDPRYRDEKRSNFSYYDRDHKYKGDRPYSRFRDQRLQQSNSVSDSPVSHRNINVEDYRSDSKRRKLDTNYPKKNYHSYPKTNNLRRHNDSGYKQGPNNRFD